MLKRNVPVFFVPVFLAAVCCLLGFWAASADAQDNAPQNFEAVASGLSVQLSWDAVPGAFRYSVYRDNSFLAGPTTPGFTDGAVEAGRTYQYKVMGLEAEGVYFPFSETITVTVTEPDVPDGAVFPSAADWILQTGDIISFGDHAGDPGFEPSQPGDTESIKIVIGQDQNKGSSAAIRFPSGTQEAWASFCVRLGDDWDARNPNGGKFPGFSGNNNVATGGNGGRSSTGDNSWSARGTWWPMRQDGTVPLGYYVYNTNQAGQYGDLEPWSLDRQLANAATAERGQWYSVTQHIVMNERDRDNGLLEAWFDGEQVYRKSDFNFTNNDEFREVYRFWLNIYHGGGERAESDHTVYFDQVNYSLGGQNRTELNCGGGVGGGGGGPVDPGPGPFECQADEGVLSWTDHDQPLYWTYRSVDGGENYEWMGKTLGATTLRDPLATDGARYQVHYDGIARRNCTTVAEPTDPGPGPFECTADGGLLSWSDHGQSRYWTYRSVDGGETYQWLGRTTGATSLQDPNPTVGARYQVHYQGIPRSNCTIAAEPVVN